MINSHQPEVVRSYEKWLLYLKMKNKDLPKLAECKHGTVYKKNANTSWRMQKKSKDQNAKILEAAYSK